MLCRLLMLIAAGSLAVAAQAPTSPALIFEVASIKPVLELPNAGGGGFPPGRFFMSNATLRTLVRMAYDVLADYQVINAGASWIGSEEFAVDARAAAVDGKTATQAQVRRMLQALLAERFKLTIRRETREMPTYRLVFARADQQLGPRLRPSQLDCSTREAQDRARAVMANGHVPCGTTMVPTSGGLMRHTADGVEFSQLTTVAAVSLQRQVTNETGLSGRFDWEVSWASELNVEGPALVTAFEEQLGLKLEPGRGPVEVLVIESATHPTPN